MTNTIYFRLLRDNDSGSSSSFGSSQATSVQGEAERSNVKALSLYSVIAKAFFACARPSPALLTEDTATALDEVEEDQQAFFACARPSPALLTEDTATALDEVEEDQQQIHRFDSCAANLKMISLDDLGSATYKFNAANILGECLYGVLYKGWIHQQKLTATKPGDGLAVAVKKLKQRYQCDQDWLEEMKHLKQLDHPNLVKLVGYCLKGNERVLVSEFIPRGSMKYRLSSIGGEEHSDCESLSWSLRMKVALDAAKGLAFLHNAEAQVIHGNFRPSNILLDADYNAKLSDFGLAKVNPDPGEVETICGPMELGHGFLSEYSALECFYTGDLTTKSDVYSFGVVLLEMLLGPEVVFLKKGFPDFDYVRRVKRCLDNTYGPSIDPQLRGQYSVEGAKKAALLALRCLSFKKIERPPMDEVVAVLETIQEI